MSTSLEILQLQLLEAVHAHASAVRRLGITCEKLKTKKAPPQEREYCRVEYFHALDALSLAHIKRCLLEARLQDVLESTLTTGAH